MRVQYQQHLWPKRNWGFIHFKQYQNTLRPLISGGGQEMNLRSGTLSPALCVGIGAA